MDGRESSNTYLSRTARRFTTLEAWREVQDGLYLAAGSTIAAITPNPTYDPEWPVRDGNPPNTRLSRLQLKSIHGYESGIRSNAFRPGQAGLWPHGPAYRTEAKDEYVLQEAQPDSASGASVELPREELDPPFHVFTNRMKWFVIITIGAAGLFSGLSSNIYLPSLSAIAKVPCNSLRILNKL